MTLTDMSKVYLIESGYDFKWINLQIDDVIMKMPEHYSDRELLWFGLYNTSLAEGWEDVSSTFGQGDNNRELAIPDVSFFSSTALVLSPKAFNVLRELLESFGEFLPVNCDGEIFQIFNCRTLVDADGSRSKQVFSNGHLATIEAIAFTNEAITGKPIFKTKYNNCSSLFCTDDLKNAVTKNGLTGVIFNEKLVPAFD
jgi:hypothetical protein